jgi:hypothetical protein
VPRCLRCTVSKYRSISSSVSAWDMEGPRTGMSELAGDVRAPALSFPVLIVQSHADADAVQFEHAPSLGSPSHLICAISYTSGGFAHLTRPARLARCSVCASPPPGSAGRIRVLPCTLAF